MSGLALGPTLYTSARVQGLSGICKIQGWGGKGLMMKVICKRKMDNIKNKHPNKARIMIIITIMMMMVVMMMMMRARKRNSKQNINHGDFHHQKRGSEAFPASSHPP